MNDGAPSRRLAVGAWLTIDATLDNEVSNLVRSGADLDAPEVARARGLRERGWAVNREHPERGLGPVGWPPSEAQFDITLSKDDIGYIVDLLTHHLEATSTNPAAGDAPSVRLLQEESNALTREALDALDALR
ncbi:hypothetical protein J2S48_005036 [Promicromonospora iranensis]|uniref:Uncharacterized protein n=2 Tax=Promicromonospora iranensis TaxID=1105144 RepID=A0ABU2CW04_9MICO|nr:hypothetical protein [Promicromonospora iranensis]